MIRHEFYEDGSHVRTVEIERAAEGVVFRRFEPPDVTVEERDATPEEIAELVAHERATDRGRAAEAVPNVVDRILSTPSPVADQMVTLMVAGGIIPVEDARAAGWEPPT